MLSFDCLKLENKLLDSNEKYFVRNMAIGIVKKRFEAEIRIFGSTPNQSWLNEMEEVIELLQKPIDQNNIITRRVDYFYHKCVKI